jgi:hypothetical protein
MNSWKSEYNRLKIALRKLGWQSVKDEASGLENWYSQGVLYSNFIKKGRAIHIEYGDEGDVFGEEIES